MILSEMDLKLNRLIMGMEIYQFTLWLNQSVCPCCQLWSFDLCTNRTEGLLEKDMFTDCEPTGPWRKDVCRDRHKHTEHSHSHKKHIFFQTHFMTAEPRMMLLIYKWAMVQGCPGLIVERGEDGEGGRGCAWSEYKREQRVGSDGGKGAPWRSLHWCAMIPLRDRKSVV